MDALVAALARSWERGEKSLVFVRRVASVTELKRNPHGRLQKEDLRDRGLTPTTWDREKTDFRITR